MVCHDAWFFAVHQTLPQGAPPSFPEDLRCCAPRDVVTNTCALRQVKPLFKRIHSRHHEIGSAITAFGTAFGDAADIGLCFVAFHLILGVYLYFQPSWNVAAVVLLIIFEVGSNSGYLLPLNIDASLLHLLHFLTCDNTWERSSQSFFLICGRWAPTCWGTVATRPRCGCTPSSRRGWG